MKLVTFRAGGAVRLGGMLGEKTVVDLAEGARRQGGAAPAALASMQDLIEAGEAGLDAARAVLAEPREAVLARRDVELLSPLPQPTQMRDFVGFETHFKNAARMTGYLRALDAGDAAGAEAIRATEEIALPPVYYRQPLYYKCNRFAVAGTESAVRFPAGCRRADYELEMGCVIGTGGRDIKAAAARDHIFGYTIFNDFTARDLQSAEMEGGMGPAKGKDFDGGNVLGPCIVTADEVVDPYRLGMRAWVNGELWSEGSSSTITWSFEQMIEHVSRDETLYAGEVLGSGTVGLGAGLEQLRFLGDGDEVVLDIEKIGRIRNTVVIPPAREAA